MAIYIYQADIYCADCAEDYIKNNPAPEGVDLENEWDYDSDDYPKGPYNEGESDSPVHCGACGELLDYTLTSDGEDYTFKAVLEHEQNGHGEVVAQWREVFYWLFDKCGCCSSYLRQCGGKHDCDDCDLDCPHGIT